MIFFVFTYGHCLDEVREFEQSFNLTLCIHFMETHIFMQLLLWIPCWLLDMSISFLVHYCMKILTFLDDAQCISCHLTTHCGDRRSTMEECTVEFVDLVE